MLGGGGGRGAEGILTEELVRRAPTDPGIRGGRPGAGAGASLALFTAAVTRRLIILDAGRTSPRLAETLRGRGGAPPVGLLGAKVEDDISGGGGARPSGAGTGGFPVPTMVDGRFGVSIELVRGRWGRSTDILEVGRPATYFNQVFKGRGYLQC